MQPYLEYQIKTEENILQDTAFSLSFNIMRVSNPISEHFD